LTLSSRQQNIRKPHFYTHLPFPTSHQLILHYQHTSVNQSIFIFGYSDQTCMQHKQTTEIRHEDGQMQGAWSAGTGQQPHSGSLRRRVTRRRRCYAEGDVMPKPKYRTYMRIPSTAADAHFSCRWPTAVVFQQPA